MENNLMIIANFEPQDNITGFLERMNRQKETGKELTCSFKYDGRCNENVRFSIDKNILCDNDYTSCQNYKKINSNQDTILRK